METEQWEDERCQAIGLLLFPSCMMGKVCRRYVCCFIRNELQRCFSLRVHQQTTQLLTVVTRCMLRNVVESLPLTPSSSSAPMLGGNYNPHIFRVPSLPPLTSRARTNRTILARARSEAEGTAPRCWNCSALQRERAEGGRKPTPAVDTNIKNGILQKKKNTDRAKAFKNRFVHAMSSSRF